MIYPLLIGFDIDAYCQFGKKSDVSSALRVETHDYLAFYIFKMPEELLAQGISLDDDLVVGDDMDDENPMYADPIDEDGAVKKIVPTHTDDKDVDDDLENPDGDDDIDSDEDM